MVTFVSSLALLLLGFLLYGKVVDKVFSPSAKRTTPAFSMRDDVDYLPMSTWRVYLIQFLNIAGTGPIYGAILGILYGPAAFLWIVFGCIFAGSVHDYFTGMISIRKGGASIPEIVGDELGTTARQVMRVISLVLLILIGAVFTRTPAELVAGMTPTNGFWGSSIFWLIVVILYYVLATLLPIDKLIGRIYPLFGGVFIFMAVCLCYGIFFGQGTVPEVTEAFTNHYPGGDIPVFPCLCITIACGAISGFHATQSPLMARCIKDERHGRKVFYGAMITEGFVALIWAAAAIKFADTLNVAGATPYEKLMNLMTEGGTHSANPAVLVNAICNSWLGVIGSILAVLGVVIAPVTSGDTAFRSARLIIAEIFRLKQNKLGKRLTLTLPLFAVTVFLFFIDFQILWRYSAWTNETLACIALWAYTVWLVRAGKNHFVTLIPALFMTMVCTTYICIAEEGFRFSPNIAYLIGATMTVTLAILFCVWHAKSRKV